MNRRVRDPYARWCGRRGAVKRLPIPIRNGEIMKFINKALFFIVLSIAVPNKSLAQSYEINNLTITKLRAVGDYPGTIYDNSLEIWFSAPLVFPSGSPCTETFRVYVDKKHQHLVSAAYMAFASSKKVNIYVDPALPIRGAACEISFIDVVN